MGADEVRVELVAPGALGEAELAACGALLGPGERARAARLRAPAAQRRFVVAHALARLALSRAAGVPPESWSFRTGPHGKPEVDGPPAGAGLRFNLSDTEGLVACAVARDLDVGVDAEAGARLRDPLALAQRFFAPGEVAALRSLAEAERRAAFLDLWSLKEALLKAVGVGIPGRLARVAFELGAGGPRLVDPGDVGGAPDDWQLALLHPTPEHRVALALRRGARADLDVVLRFPAPLAPAALSAR